MSRVDIDFGPELQVAKGPIDDEPTGRYSNEVFTRYLPWPEIVRLYRLTLDWEINKKHGPGLQHRADRRCRVRLPPARAR
jgi:hypothetical protein